MNSNLATIEQIHFRFPDTPTSKISNIPLYFQDYKLNFAFVEVGCKPSNKVAQLCNKKELFYRYWAEEYKKKFDINWFPKIFRLLAHYSPYHNLDIGGRRFGLDVVVSYEYLTKEMIGSLSSIDKEKIFKIVKKHNKELLVEILENCDNESLHNFIVNYGNKPKLASIRGIMSEIFVLKDLEKILGNDMTLHKNGNIRYFNQKYKNGTEIDGILTFYNEDDYVDLIERFRKLEHVKIKDKWHN